MITLNKLVNKGIDGNDILKHNKLSFYNKYYRIPKIKSYNYRSRSILKYRSNWNINNYFSDLRTSNYYHNEDESFDFFKNVIGPNKISNWRM